MSAKLMKRTWVYPPVALGEFFGLLPTNMLAYSLGGKREPLTLIVSIPLATANFNSILVRPVPPILGYIR